MGYFVSAIQTFGNHKQIRNYRYTQYDHSENSERYHGVSLQKEKQMKMFKILTNKLMIINFIEKHYNIQNLTNYSWFRVCGPPKKVRPSLRPTRRKVMVQFAAQQNWWILFSIFKTFNFESWPLPLEWPSSNQIPPVNIKLSSRDLASAIPDSPAQGWEVQANDGIILRLSRYFADFQLSQKSPNHLFYFINLSWNPIILISWTASM